MSSKIKHIFFFILLFILFLVWNLLFIPVNLDEIWNYGFTHNIYSGLVPYKDFNMVLTPLFPMIMALPFYIFGSSMLLFHIENAVLFILLCYFLYKMYKEKAWFIILFLFIPLPVTFPSYNLFLFLLLVVLIYCENNKKSDYLIGFLLACCCLTKQSVGVCMLLPSLYYIKDLKKIGKRIIGFLGPCILFLIYLLVTKSFSRFLDLCLFGLFDFARDNGKLFNIFFLLFIVIICYVGYLIKKDRNNINNYYVLAFFSVIVPLFDMYHFQILFLGFLLLIVSKFKFLEKINVRLLLIGCIIGISCIGFIKGNHKEIIYPNDIKYFEYRLLDSESILFTKEVNDYMRINSDKNFVFLCSNGYYFRLVNDMPISYLDLINAGNWGYNGSDKLLDAVKNVEDAIFVVDLSELSLIKQTDKQVINYVLENGKKIDSIRIYDIYVIE